MRLTTRGRFAVAAMIDLALREQRGAVALASIGQRQQISLSYLEQLFSNLRQAGIVESTRGPGGGYTLARKAGDINVADILIAVDKPPAASRSRHKNDAVTAELWDSLNLRMTTYLQSISLQNLVDEQVAKGVTVDDAPAKVTQGVRPQPAPHPKVNAPNSVFALGKMLAMGR